MVVEQGEMRRMRWAVVDQLSTARLLMWESRAVWVRRTRNCRTIEGPARKAFVGADDGFGGKVKGGLEHTRPNWLITGKPFLRWCRNMGGIRKANVGRRESLSCRVPVLQVNGTF